MRLRLVLFDVDGTLVDSQNAICTAAATAFTARGLPAPGRAATLAIVGLSLDRAMARLAPDQPEEERAALVDAYRAAFATARRNAATPSPLYPGVEAGLAQLSARPERLLGVATGKSRRGLEALLTGHGLTDHFVTRQTADDHPSKPHPSMIRTAMAETGVAPEHTVMIGDTSYDMDMAHAAGVTAVGVNWGYHDADALNADHMVTSFGHLVDLIERLETDTA